MSKITRRKNVCSSIQAIFTEQIEAVLLITLMSPGCTVQLYSYIVQLMMRKHAAGWARFTRRLLQVAPHHTRHQELALCASVLREK